MEQEASDFHVVFTMIPCRIKLQEALIILLFQDRGVPNPQVELSEGIEKKLVSIRYSFSNAKARVAKYHGNS